ncbi:conserved hypothetical protein [Vibrio nigripulchritudo MADA3029]|uniref:hypothetical protein n=2 Tax=Vibrio nigripulchritudo TaxID=28173 RepID=UPI0003B1EC4F|nr:hypothetical protein [Vibrio nigripulchritudo]KJY75958.1 hypothetical protein TW74_16505 [Vibrio nigripulchritudo]CCN49267.1 conserved hypothetical protein [Vibrio nigripulchritudo MADA3020]CCN54251.1 conserved hypothetical protein [Vibrio nigripulchritudo MADA3021]CCN61322.1 conserved hypothetical protein [Vibrio nigripulchritudo MADA3029]
MKKCYLVFLCMFLSMPTYAGNKDCGVVALKTVYVQADRVDGSTHGNKMLVGFSSSSCPNIKLAYLENTDDAYSGMLSIALTAYTSGKKIRVFVDDSKDASGAKRLQWLNFQ